MRKRFYILFVARDAEGQLLKIPIPIHYLYVFIAGALIGMFTVTGMAGSYTRMLMKVARFNELRTEKQALETKNNQLEKVAQQREIQVASLGSLASEVSALYGLRAKPALVETRREFDDEVFATSLDQLHALKRSAMSGVATMAIHYGSRNATLADWAKLAATPSLWPTEGLLTSSFGERLDPFNGEGAFHRGVDISVPYGTRVVAPADGIVRTAEFMGGYGRAVILEHGNNTSTLYAHLSRFAVVPGQRVQRGELIGFVGSSGRSQAPHLHYEVRINGTPVNPHKYLRASPRMLASFSEERTGM